MGYRSDVRLIVSKKGYDELEKFIEKELNKEGKTEEYNILKCADFLKEHKNYFYIAWNYVKWYEEYTDVMIFNRALGYLSGKDYSWRFARIGENYDDVEENYHNSNRLEEDGLDYPYIIREFDDGQF